jgi:hypothetical protein
MTTNFTKWPKSIPIGRKISQRIVKYANIFHSKALQNVPNWDFWYENIPHLATLVLMKSTEIRFIGSNHRKLDRYQRHIGQNQEGFKSTKKRKERQKDEK